MPYKPHRPSRSQRYEIVENYRAKGAAFAAVRFSPATSRNTCQPTPRALIVHYMMQAQTYVLAIICSIYDSSLLRLPGSWLATFRANCQFIGRFTRCKPDAPIRRAKQALASRNARTIDMHTAATLAYEYAGHAKMLLLLLCYAVPCSDPR